MTNEKWEQVKEVFDAALRHKPDERAQFLDEVCGDDEAMRREVQALLSSFGDAGSFMARPVVGEKSEAVTIQKTGLTQGQYLGHYEISGQIGAGGMGEVYLARDTRLNRAVALKVLSAASVSDPEANRRLWREARAAATLDHPNICAIHEIGETEGCSFIVMQYVIGETLAHQLGRERMGLSEVLNTSVQVVAALEEAHAHGIIHRDIKPGNIIINDKGQVKILDFGLAKFTENLQTKSKIVAAEPSSNSGAIMGTVPFMSPEQVRGQRLDARTDIFSFGAMIYEMSSGRQPFDRDTDAETISAILRDEPSWEEIPGQLQPIVCKCLMKNADQRYQTAKDLAAALRELRQLLPHSAKTPRLERAARRIRWAAAAILMAVGLAGGIALIVLRLHRPAVPTLPQYTQLTNFADSATSPALSPHGDILAFIRGGGTFGGPGQIYVKSLPDGEPVQLTHDKLIKRGSPKFSPDGKRIAYSAYTLGATWDTWVVQVLGGQPRLLLANASGLTWIESGGRLLFSELTGRAHQMAIVTSTESRTQRRTVYLPAETGMAHHSYLSPDGKQVLLAEMDHGTWLPCRLTPFDGSSPGRPVGPAPAQCTDAAWSPDGKWMYLSANNGNGYHIWRQRFPDGAPVQITSSVTQEEGIELARDGRSFVTSIGTSQSTLWFHDSRGDRQITSEGYALHPSVSPDGKKLYYMLRVAGAQHFVSGELWVADLESGQRQRLLPDFLIQYYAISSDGQRVVFIASDDAGHSAVWLAPLDGRFAPRPVTTIDSRKASFAEGGYVIFAGEEKGETFIYRAKEDGSELQKVLRPASSLFSASPDGKWVVMTPVSTGEMKTASMVYPIDGGPPRLMCVACIGEHPAMHDAPPAVSWSPDGKFIYLNFQESLYAIPLRPGQMLPPIPASGFRSKEDTLLAGARLIPQQGAFPGPNPSIYAFTKVATHRNIYRVAVP